MKNHASHGRLATIVSAFLLILTAIIWGASFISQKLGMDYVGPYAFTVGRSLLGGVFLLLVLWGRKALEIPTPHGDSPKYWRTVFRAGFFCGTALFVGLVFQQVGLQTTPAGISGFITTNYVMIVPILGLFLGLRPRGTVWIGVLLALAGLYLISTNGTTKLVAGIGEALTLGGAFCFSIQILVIDHYVPKTDIIAMSCVELFVCFVEGLPFLLLPSEQALLSPTALWKALPAIAYAGVMSSGVGFTLQMIAQKRMPAALASIIMSMESVFAMLFGMLLLHESHTPAKLLGCLLVFIAVVFTQLCETARPTDETTGQAKRA